MNKNSFETTDSESSEELYIVKQTVVAGVSYLLVSETDPEGDAESGSAFILKDTSEEGDEEAVYVELDDDDEYESISEIFRLMLEEDEIDLEE